MKSRSSKGRFPISRRDLLRSGGLATAAGIVGPAEARELAAEPTPDVYTRIGARPFINCTATYTINGGSRTWPEVIDAIAKASHYHVNLDQLMEAAGKRLAELLQAPWAIVTSGAAAALSHATAACVAGADPEKIQQLPDLTGLRNEVIIPRSSENQYFHAIRAVGVRTIQIETADQLRAAINHRTAMIAVLGNRYDKVTPSLEEVTALARKAGVPVLVDAAADYLIVPNPYLAAGADMVAYSGGKINRGPQSAGLLMGREDLVRAAFANSAPHHAFGRMMKVSKEEIIGMLTAVEICVTRRNLDAEYNEWKSWYAHIARTVEAVDGVRTKVMPPTRGGPFPILNIEWDAGKIGFTAGELFRILLDGEPSIMTHAEGEGNSFMLRPVAMKPGDYKIVAARLRDVFANAPSPRRRELMAPKFDISGRWDVEIRYALGQAAHTLYLETQGNAVSGTHAGSRLRGELTGTVDGDRVSLRSTLPCEGNNLSYTFEGTVSDDRMAGDLNLGEYPRARWTAERFRYGSRPAPRDHSKPF